MSQQMPQPSSPSMPPTGPGEVPNPVRDPMPAQPVDPNVPPVRDPGTGPGDSFPGAVTPLQSA